MRIGKSPGVFLGSAFVLTVAASPARGADGDVSTKARCAASYETAQVLRRQERLEAARAELQICKETCPEKLARDCDIWHQEVIHLIPTVRLSAQDPEGRRLEGVRVSIDGHALGGDLGAASIFVEPGVHVFRFEREGRLPSEVRAELHVGERDRAVTAVLGPVPKAHADGGPAHLAPGSRTPSYIVGGIGVAALATAGVLAIKGHADRGSLRSSCAPECDSEQVDSVRTLWWTAAGVGAVGAVAVGLAVFLWPRQSHASNRAVPTVALAPRSVALTWDLP